LDKGASGTNQVPTVFNARYIDTTHADDVVRMDNTAAPLQARDYRGGKLVYDARGNGDGKTVCTITGDHQNRVTDYTALCVGNGQLNQMSMAEQANTLDTMHDQQAILCGNPWDPQSERVFHGDGAWHSLAGNSGGGQSRDAVMAFDKEMYNCGKHCTGTPQAREDTVAPTCRADAHPSGVAYNAIVRRLTPGECELLQGFPKNWTLIGEPEEVEVKDYEMTYDEDGNDVGKRLVGTHKEIEYFYTDRNGKRRRCADSNRYKALGNSLCLPFWEWLAKRICAQYERTVTMASLFDGIGGFPLVFQRCGAVPVWASEIEEFPIAVTKVRFPDESV
jgi:DNA (cytosine-5)-methyltransferase 1